MEIRKTYLIHFMNYSFNKDFSSALIDQIKSDQVEYIFAKKLRADREILIYMRKKISIMKKRVKQKKRSLKVEQD
jgi:hypothetical protein